MAGRKPLPTQLKLVKGTARPHRMNPAEPQPVVAVPLTPDHLDDAAVQAGDEVTLEITPTKDWPEPTVPADLRVALDGAPDTLDVWTDITPMARWEWVRWIGATKNPATRAKRVDVTISKMRSGKRRPCCWPGCKHRERTGR